MQLHVNVAWEGWFNCFLPAQFFCKVAQYWFKDFRCKVCEMVG